MTACSKRLRTDRIDLLYQHRVDPRVPIEDVAGAIKDLMSQGKVLHWARGDWARTPCAERMQSSASPRSRTNTRCCGADLEKWVLSACQDLGIGFVCWSPLGVGFLTGAIDAHTRFADGDIRGAETRFSPDSIPQNLALVGLLKSWAERKQATPGQISLAWLLAQKPWTVPTPGTTQMAHMVENTGGAEIVFTPDELAELNAAVSAIRIQGMRLPESVLAYSDVEAPSKN